MKVATESRMELRENRVTQSIFCVKPGKN